MKRSASVCFSHFELLLVTNETSLPSLTPLNPTISVIFNSPLCCLNPSHSIKTLHFFLPSCHSMPPLPPPPPSPHLQVVKWILLSRSHQGKKRKRRRMEPKVNSKEVGMLIFLLLLPPLRHFLLFEVDFACPPLPPRRAVGVTAAF